MEDAYKVLYHLLRALGLNRARILKCNSGQSTGFQFNFPDIFNDKINMYMHFDQFSILLKFTKKNWRIFSISIKRTVACMSLVLSDL